MIAFGKVITVSDSSNITTKEQLMMIDGDSAEIHSSLLYDLMALGFLLTANDNSCIKPHESKKPTSGCDSSAFVSGMVLGSLLD